MALRAEREHIVTLIVAAIAMLVIFGGFASFSGLAVHNDPLVIVKAKGTFARGDVFDVAVQLAPVTFMADESIVLYLDDNVVGVIALKKYLDDNGVDYGTEIKNLGQNNQEILTLMNPVSINLADYVSLEMMAAGTHTLRAEFSLGDAYAEDVFGVE